MYKGRSKSLSDAEVSSMKAAVDREVPKAKVAREYGISRATLYRYLKGQASNPLTISMVSTATRVTLAIRSTM